MKYMKSCDLPVSPREAASLMETEIAAAGNSGGKGDKNDPCCFQKGMEATVCVLGHCSECPFLGGGGFGMGFCRVEALGREPMVWECWGASRGLRLWPWGCWWGRG